MMLASEKTIAFIEKSNAKKSLLARIHVRCLEIKSEQIFDLRIACLNIVIPHLMRNPEI